MGWEAAFKGIAGGIFEFGFTDRCVCEIVDLTLLRSRSKQKVGIKILCQKVDVGREWLKHDVRKNEQRKLE